jgi:hypothetical protein
MSKIVELQVLGSEPELEGEVSRVELANALNWYNYFYSVNGSKKWIIAYMKNNGYSTEQISKYNKSNSTQISQTWCSIARMLNNGAMFDNKLDDHIESVINSKKPRRTRKVAYKLKDENELLADLDDIVDQFIISGYKDIPEFGDVFKDRKNNHVKEALDHYKGLLLELQEFMDDKDLKEGYAFLTKRKQNKYVKLIEEILAGLSFTQVSTKRTRKPRRKKKFTSKELTKLMKYQEKSDDYNITSLTPDQIIGANIVFLFNTKTRVLTKLVALDRAGLSVYRMKVTNVDEKESFSTRLRKPQDILETIMTKGIRAINSKIGMLTTMMLDPQVKVNQHVLFVRMFK